jgi:hypothetical protein
VVLTATAGFVWYGMRKSKVRSGAAMLPDGSRPLSSTQPGSGRVPTYSHVGRTRCLTQFRQHSDGRQAVLSEEIFCGRALAACSIFRLSTANIRACIIQTTGKNEDTRPSHSGRKAS